MGELTGDAQTGRHFLDYLGQQADGSGQGFLGVDTFQGSNTAYVFFLITAAVNLWVLSRGLSKGIEVIAKIGMPVLLLTAVALVARVLTLPEFEGRTAADGLGIYWNPDFGRLFDFENGASAIWLAMVRFQMSS